MRKWTDWVVVLAAACALGTLANRLPFLAGPAVVLMYVVGRWDERCGAKYREMRGRT